MGSACYKCRTPLRSVQREQRSIAGESHSFATMAEQSPGRQYFPRNHHSTTYHYKVEISGNYPLSASCGNWSTLPGSLPSGRGASGTEVGVSPRVTHPFHHSKTEST